MLLIQRDILDIQQLTDNKCKSYKKGEIKWIEVLLADMTKWRVVLVVNRHLQLECNAMLWSGSIEL